VDQQASVGVGFALALAAKDSQRLLDLLLRLADPSAPRIS
jgi:hypothetical protein